MTTMTTTNPTTTTTTITTEARLLANLERCVRAHNRAAIDTLELSDAARKRILAEMTDRITAAYDRLIAYRAQSTH
jgi:hypothetical protein